MEMAFFAWMWKMAGEFATSLGADITAKKMFGEAIEKRGGKLLGIGLSDEAIAMNIFAIMMRELHTTEVTVGKEKVGGKEVEKKALRLSLSQAEKATAFDAFSAWFNGLTQKQRDRYRQVQAEKASNQDIMWLVDIGIGRLSDDNARTTLANSKGWINPGITVQRVKDAVAQVTRHDPAAIADSQVYADRRLAEQRQRTAAAKTKFDAVLARVRAGRKGRSN